MPQLPNNLPELTWQKCGPPTTIGNYKYTRKRPGSKISLDSLPGPKRTYLHGAVAPTHAPYFAGCTNCGSTTAKAATTKQ